VLHHRSVPVYLVSGGLRGVITPVALELNIPLQNVHANRLKFFFNGKFLRVYCNRECYALSSESFRIYLLFLRVYCNRECYALSSESFRIYFLVQFQLLFLLFYSEQLCKTCSNKFQVSLLDLMKMNQHHEMAAKRRL
jgi:hypothetical protein